MLGRPRAKALEAARPRTAATEGAGARLERPAEFWRSATRRRFTDEVHTAIRGAINAVKHTYGQ